MKILYLAYAVIAACTLHHYISWQSVNVVLGIIAMPIVTTVQRDNKQSLRFAWVALFFGAVCLWLPVKTLLFLSIVFACFFITESCVGKMNLLPVLVAGIISPVFQYASNVISFPLRLWLTDVAGSMMNASVAGNMIVYNGNEFSVDPACMGLNMLVVGLLLQVMLIAVFQKQLGVRLSGWLVIVLMALSVVMNVVSNLFRIICLVYFNVLPGTVMHDVMGICCLLVYVVLPMIYVTRWVVKRTGKVMVHTPANATKKKLVFIHIVLLVTIGLSAIAVGKANESPSDIVKLEKEHALIYIKPIRGFYSADHNPTICWRGSGYEFKQVAKTGSVYTAIIENGTDRLYTAWWYDNGTIRTTSQLTWRWHVLKGGKEFSLINVTTANEQELQLQIHELFQKRIL